MFRRRSKRYRQITSNLIRHGFGCSVIGLMDYGLMDYMDEREKESFLRILYFMVRGEVDEMLDALADLGIRMDLMTSRQALKRDLGHLLFRFQESSLAEKAAGEIFGQMMSIAYRRQLIFPSDMAMLFKVLGIIKGLGTLPTISFKF